MVVTDLNKRRKKILQAIVELYIETAVPVSSQAIAQRLRWRISAATIRNVMAELIEMDLIWQPHTSAGRIPTDKAYRYYIDSLLELEQLTSQEKEFIESQYPARNEAFEELLKEILRLLSSFSGYTTVAFSSGLTRILFKKLEFVSLQTSKLLVVLISPEGLVKTTVVQVPYKIEQPELLKIARFLNAQFEGLALDEIKERLSLQVLNTQDAFFHILRKATQILELAFGGLQKDELYLEGTSCILKQPEFQNAQKLQAIFRAFEKQEPLLSIIKRGLDVDGVRVYIGKEGLCEDIQECSLVLSNFKIEDRYFGTLGVIGPRRMCYAKVISAVDYMADILSQRLLI
ncbi:MAG: heat-inducible transcription repressor HrcA [Candidatus Omnitrophica bacterium]|nr:heat-inducible transcription repressor HrcA [Candidatus Omnitrophota bacterium]